MHLDRSGFSEPARCDILQQAPKELPLPLQLGKLLQVQATNLSDSQIYHGRIKQGSFIYTRLDWCRDISAFNINPVVLP